MTDDVLDQSMDVAGYPIRIHPPTASRPYHQIVYRVGGKRWVLARRVRPAIGHMTCQELRRTDIQRVVDSSPTPGEGARVRRVLGTALRWGHRHGYLVTAPERLIGDVHWAGQREVQAHEQGTDPLWVPPDEIPSHRCGRVVQGDGRAVPQR